MVLIIFCCNSSKGEAAGATNADSYQDQLGDAEFEELLDIEFEDDSTGGTFKLRNIEQLMNTYVDDYDETVKLTFQEFVQELAHNQIEDFNPVDPDGGNDPLKYLNILFSIWSLKFKNVELTTELAEIVKFVEEAMTIIEAPNACVKNQEEEEQRVKTILLNMMGDCEICELMQCVNKYKEVAPDNCSKFSNCPFDWTFPDMQKLKNIVTKLYENNCLCALCSAQKKKYTRYSRVFELHEQMHVIPEM